MTVSRRLAALLLGLLPAACAIGTQAAGWRPANQAAGVEVELDLTSNKVVKGELLAVDSAAFTVLEPARLVRVPFAVVRNGGAYKTGFSGPDIDAGTRERLRLMSRYPQGLTPAVTRDLLESYGLSRLAEEP